MNKNKDIKIWNLIEKFEDIKGETLTISDNYYIERVETRGELFYIHFDCGNIVKICHYARQDM